MLTRFMIRREWHSHPWYESPRGEFAPEELQKLYAPSHVERLRQRFGGDNAHDEAYGAIFKLEGVIVDFVALEKEAWRRVAETNGNLPAPTEEDARQSASVHPEEAADKILLWTIVGGTNQTTKEGIQYEGEFFNALQQVYRESHGALRLQRGVQKWLEILKQYKVPCGVFSTRLRYDQVVDVLGRAGVPRDLYFDDTIVSCLDDGHVGLNWHEQAYLHAAQKMMRSPDRCAVFVDSPKAVVAAHDVQMKAIAAVNTGGYSQWELKLADLQIQNMEDLSIMSLRRVFSDRDFEREKPEEETEPEKEPEEPSRWTPR